MRIDIQSTREPLAPEHRAQTERLVGLALSRLNGLVSRVDVQFDADPAQPARHVRVQVHLAGGDTVAVEEAGSELAALINRSIARAGQLAQRRTVGPRGRGTGARPGPVGARRAPA